MARVHAFGCFLAAVIAVTAQADRADDFAREAVYENVVVSPGGHYLTVVFRADGEEFVATLDRSSLESRSKLGFGSRFGVADLVWANDERLLIWPSERFWTIDWKAPTGEIVGMNADGTLIRVLFGVRAGDGRKGGLMRAAEAQAAWGDLVELLPGERDRVLIASHGFSERGRSSTAGWLDVRNGRFTPIVHSPLLDGAFVATPEGEILFTFGFAPDGRYALYRRSPDDGQFVPVMMRGHDEGRLVPVRAADPRTVLVYDDEDAVTTGLSVWNPATGQKQSIFRHARVDVDEIWFDGRGTTPYALRFVEHYPDYFYPEPRHPLALAHRTLRERAGGADVTFTSVTRDDGVAVAFVSSDRNPGTFYLVDVSRGTFTKISDVRPWLDPNALAPTEPIALTVRDKTPVSAYLTTPHGFRAPGPLVVMVHGGPHGVRDEWGFDADVQFLAASGYAVLQVNYRGSGGFGRPFLVAGYGEWGGAMQRDVTDATRWAIADGVADPKRICIFGASYGAYSALTGAFQEPDLYRCAIGYAGVYDLPLMFEEGDVQMRRSGASYLASTLGSDLEALRARSPVYNAERIRAAVMLVHGRKDRRAPYEHAERLRDALERAGNPPEWIAERGEGHGFFGEGNRADLYRRLAAFLDRHIGAGAVTAN